MDAKEDPAPFQKRLSPAALLLGVAVGFAGCCAAGHWAGRLDIFGDEFKRFQYMSSIETFFFPTACHVRELARNKLPADKIGVIVAGSSRLYGMCQPHPHTFAEELQRHLGDEYRVINLAMRGGRGMEVGAVTADMLRHERPRLMLVTDTQSANLAGEPDGLVYRYFYWDAYYKGLLTPDEARRRYLDNADQSKRGEARLGRHFDSTLRFNDLWNAVGYKAFFTVYAPLNPKPFTTARDQFAGDDWEAVPLPPAPQRFLVGGNQMDALRNCELIDLKDLAPRAGGGYAEAPGSHRFAGFRNMLRLSLPQWLRERTVMLVQQCCPYHREQLPPEEQARCLAGIGETVKVLRQEGFAGASVGADWTEDDYLDVLHPNQSGGMKEGYVVAGFVREQARKLGYLTAEPSSSAAARTEVGGK